MNIILYEPEIPPNTGNIIRLCANTGASLHLIQPMGFTLETKALRRAGLDYHETTDLQIYESLDACLEQQLALKPDTRVYAVTTKGEHSYHNQQYRKNDMLLFGPESRGLPDDVLYSPRTWRRIRLPMKASSRSMNLSNAVAVVTFEILRQLDFPDLVY
ncbi:MAG: tRNA (cytidine(34)-2'-O)-methyltransferase [Granulosicoccus sp.]